MKMKPPSGPKKQTQFKPNFFKGQNELRYSHSSIFLSLIALITYIQSDLYFPFGLIDDSFGARKYIFSDYSPANVFAE